MTRCVAPSCAQAAQGGPFCESCARAPAGRRGGWLSAAKRKPYDANAIAPRLWVGGKPAFDRDLPQVDVLILCAAELQPLHLSFHGQVLRCPLPDDVLSQAQVAAVVSASVTATKAVIQGQRVLATCQMGRNRSALVAALALAQLTTMSGEEVIKHVQKHRAGSLYNASFRKLIGELVGEGRRRAPRRPSTDS